MIFTQNGAYVALHNYDRASVKGGGLTAQVQYILCPVEY